MFSLCQCTTPPTGLYSFERRHCSVFGDEDVQFRTARVFILAAIIIYRKKYVPNGNGYTTKVTEPVALNVWAYFRQLSGKEIFAAAAYRYDEEVLFTINYRAGLTTACYVEYSGVKYSVTRIDTFEGYKQDITLYCKRM